MIAVLYRYATLMNNMEILERSLILLSITSERMFGILIFNLTVEVQIQVDLHTFPQTSNVSLMILLFLCILSILYTNIHV